MLSPAIKRFLLNDALATSSAANLSTTFGFPGLHAVVFAVADERTARAQAPRNTESYVRHAAVMLCSSIAR
jgi:hypothetical protein